MDFQPDRSLPGSNQRIVKRMHKRHAGLHAAIGLGEGGRDVRAENDLGTVTARRVEVVGRR